jgi:hypothetical protein
MIFMLLWLMPGTGAADWLEDAKALGDEIRGLTANAEGLSDEQRLQRFYTLSYDLAMLEYPEFATALGDPRGQDRLTDLSQDGVQRRRQATRASLALLESIDRSSLPESERVNYELLLDTVQRQVSGLRFPQELLQMNQMGGPQQDLSSLLAMMPGATAAQLRNQIARMEALPAYVDQSIVDPQPPRGRCITEPAAGGLRQDSADRRPAAGRRFAAAGGRSLSLPGGAGLRTAARIHRK